MDETNPASPSEEPEEATDVTAEDEALVEAVAEAAEEVAVAEAAAELIEEAVEDTAEELVAEGVPADVAVDVAEELVAEAVEEAVEEAAAEEAIEEAVADEAFVEALEEATDEAEATAEVGLVDEAVVVAAEEAAFEAVGADEPVAVAVADAEVSQEVAERPKRSRKKATAEPVEAVEGNGRDPFRGPGDWYVVHTYAGYENKVKTNLASRILSMQMQDKIFEIEIPMEDVMEIKGGKKQVLKKKVFPGYLLVKMIYDNDSWYVVRNTPGVTGFVSSGTGTKPTPLSRREVEKILVVKEETARKPEYRLEFEEGDVVRIIAGPFADFNGTINEINVDQSKLKVLVNIFDRETPVELGFDQVAKV
jgi:transcriptional antiterminator NusG